MPVSIPAGTKFEAIKPTTVVNRRSALVNSNDQTFTIEDIVAAAGGGTFPITNNYIPKADNTGGLIDSSLYEVIFAGDKILSGLYDGGLSFSTTSSAELIVINSGLPKFARIGDTYGSNGPPFGIDIDSASGGVNIITNGVNVLGFNQLTGDYQIGGSTSRFGIKDADTVHPTLQVSPDMIQNILGINYLLIDISGTVYKIQLIP